MDQKVAVLHTPYTLQGQAVVPHPNLFPTNGRDTHPYPFSRPLIQLTDGTKNSVPFLAFLLKNNQIG